MLPLVSPAVLSFFEQVKQLAVYKSGSTKPDPGMPKLNLARPHAASPWRRAWLVGAASLPFACSVYGPSDLQGGAQAEAGGGQLNSSAGVAAAGGAMTGGGASHSGGTAGASIAGMSTSGAGGSSLSGGTSGTSGVGGTGKGGTSASAGGGGGAPPGPTGGSGAGAGDASAGEASGGEAGAGNVNTIPGLVASFPCESATGAVLADASGHGRNATLSNGSGGSPTGFAFGAGMVGNGLSLSSANMAYVSLPQGIVSSLQEATIATWVKLKSGAAFQRIFDFGLNTSTFMYLVNAGSSGLVRFRISSTPLNKNQVVEGAEALPVGKWVHVAVTIGNGGVSIYVDGSQVAQQAPAAMRPSDLGDTGNNFIGRSPFAADPYLDGQIDEFRIYGRVLSPVEIAAVANGQ